MDFRDDAFGNILEGICAVALASARAPIDLQAALVDTFIRGVVADIRAHAAHRETELLSAVRALLSVCINLFRAAPRHLSINEAFGLMLELQQTERFCATYEVLSHQDRLDHARHTGKTGNALRARATELLRT